MAYLKPQASSSTAHRDELSKMVLDLVVDEPLDTVSSLSSNVQVFDSSGPLGPTSPQVQDFSEPPLLDSTSINVQMYESREPLGHSNHLQALVSIDPLGNDSISCPSGTQGFSLLSSTSSQRVHCNVEEIRNMMSWVKLYLELGTKEQCIIFAEQRGLLPTNKKCHHHKKPMSLTPQNLVGAWRCTKGKCRNKKISRAIGTFFEQARISIPMIFKLLYAFSQGCSYDNAQLQTQCPNEPILSCRTICDWYSKFRETVVIYELEHQVNGNKIGGPNKIVRMAESKFGMRKHIKGRQIEGHWVIGMIEDGSKDLRLVVCPGDVGSGEILVPLIQNHVEEGSIIYTDSWQAYLILPQIGYIHNRFYQFDQKHRLVAPDEANTQQVESHWQILKQKFQKEKKKKIEFADWLCEYSWRRKIKTSHLDPFEELIKTIVYVYHI